MINIILILVLVAIAASVVFYLVREKKRGVTCVGCPYARECAKKHAGQGCTKAPDGSEQNRPAE